MSPEAREKHVLQVMRTCEHFNGIQHDCCEAGVSYDSVRDSNGRVPVAFPCLPGFRPATTTCDKRKLPTREEAERIEADREKAIKAFLRKSELGICGTCDVRSTDWVQAGSCIYSKPCGHRVGQGDAVKYKAGVLKARERVSEAANELPDAETAQHRQGKGR